MPMETPAVPKHPRWPLMTVAWSWIVLGVVLSVAGLMSMWDSGIAPLLRIEAVGFLVVGLAGTVAGVGLLALRGWARNVLEVLTWATLAFMLWNLVTEALFTFRFMREFDANPLLALLSVLPWVLWNVLLALLLHTLRSSRVKESVAAPA